MYDPGEFADKNILVVGGGDSSLECSIALAKSGNRIIHSYRKEEFSRPKEENMNKFDDLVEQGKITPFFESTVTGIRGKRGCPEKQKKKMLKPYLMTLSLLSLDVNCPRNFSNEAAYAWRERKGYYGGCLW